MRKIYFFLAMLFAVNGVWGQTYNWNQTGLASWTVSTNWTPTRTTPATSDILVFDNGATTTVTNLPTQTIGQLLVSGSTIVNLQAGAAATLTISGGTGTDLDVASGSQLNFNTINVITLNLATGTTGSISGSMTFSAGASTAHRLTAVDASAITFNSGSTFIAGPNFSGSAFGTTNLNSVIFASGSTYILQAGSNPFGAGQPSSVVVFQTGSLYKHQAAAAPSASGRTYANFEYNIASSQSVVGTSAFVCDNLTVTLGTFNCNVTATPGHAIKGNISVASGATLTFTPAAAGTINFNGTSAQTISNSGTLTFTTNAAVVIASTSGVTFNNAQTISGTMTVNAGALLATSAALTLSGTNTINGSFQLNQSGAVVGTLAYGAASTLIYAGTSTQTASATEFPSASGPNNLTSNNSVGLTFPGAFVRTIAGNLNLLSGVLNDGGNIITVGGNITGTATHAGAGKITMTGSGKTISAATLQNLELNNAGVFSLSGSPTVNGTLILTTGTLDMNGKTLTLLGTGTPITGPGILDATTNTPNTIIFAATGAQNISSLTYYNLTIGGTGTKTLAGNTTVNGSLTNGSTSTLDANAKMINLGINWTNNGGFSGAGSTVNFNGSGTNLIAGVMSTPYKFDIMNFNSGTYNIIPSSTIAAVTLNINFSTVNSATYEFQVGSNVNINLGGDLISDGIIRVGQNFTYNTGGTFTPGTNNLIDFTGPTCAVNGTKADQAVWDIISNVGTSLTVNGPAKLRVRNMTIASGASVSITGVTLQVYYSGNFTNNSGPSAYVPGTSEAIVNGTSAQAINGSFPTTFNILELDNTNGLSLSTDITATNLLKFTNGKITLGANNLIVGSAISGATSARYVVTNGAGALRINNIGASNVVFPVGPSTSLYHPVTINNAGTIDNFSLKLTSVAPICVDISKSVLETWNITETLPGGSNCTLTFDYTGATEGGLYTAGLAQIVHCSGATADYHNGSVTGSVATGSGFTSFSPFGISSDPVALPVKFANVKAYQQGSSIKIDWSNLTETNVLNYIVERSANGINFTTISTTAALRNDGGRADYTSLDVSPLNGVNFYRIRSNEFDGKSLYSAIMKVNTKGGVAGIDIYPNPVTGGQVSLQTTGLSKGQYTIRIFNANGQQVLRQLMNHNGGAATEVIQLPAALKTGMYSLQLSGGEVQLAKSFIIK